MSRIGECFARLKKTREAALVPFLMAGDPDLDVTRELVLAATEAGADLIELGIPFSDPTADGPVLQRSATRALERGTSLARVLDLVGQLRREIDTPIVLFGYYNPIFHYGPARLAADAKSAGVDGLLVVDLPPEEADELWKPACSEGLDVIFLLAPTSDEKRIGAVLKKARGFVYYVSMTGVTGSKAIEATDVRQAVDGMRDRCRLPIGVGFGISSAAAARDVAEFADAVIVGSAIMRLVETQNQDPHLVESVAAFVRDLKSATRRPAPAAA
jgi:tryptophan synthase alpha chain